MSLKKFWEIFLLSFYSKDLYIAVSEVWQNWGLRYLLNLSIFLVIITNCVFFINLYFFDFNQPEIINLLDKIPEFTIENNDAKANDSSIKYPVRIKSELSGNQDLIIVDLNIKEADQYKQNVIVFTKDRIAFNFIDNPSFDLAYNDVFKNNTKIEFNTKSIIEIMSSLRNKMLGILIVLGIPLGSLIMFIVLLIKALFYASVTNVFLKISNKIWDIKKLTRIAIVSNTPALIVSVFLTTMFFQYSLTSTSQFLIGSIFMFYFAFAIISCGQFYKNEN